MNLIEDAKRIIADGESSHTGLIYVREDFLPILRAFVEMAEFIEQCDFSFCDCLDYDGDEHEPTCDTTRRRAILKRIRGEA